MEGPPGSTSNKQRPRMGHASVDVAEREPSVFRSHESMATELTNQPPIEKASRVNLTETSWTVEDSKKVADLVDPSVREVPEADWDIAMAEITAHLLTAYRGIESLPVPAAPREASLSFVAASRFLSAALVAIDEGCIAVWSDDSSGDTIGVGRPRVPPEG
jgi:hypothetical protein